MKNWLFVLLMFPLAACSAAASSQPALQAQMSQMDQAEVWLNSDLPLRLADLRGQVVLLDMWTFG
jgi:hypothetical protein